MPARGKLKYEADFYQPSSIRNYMREGGKEAEAAVRKEYTRLRDIAQKRLKRMGATMWADTQTYKRNVNHYPKLKDIQSQSELAARLSDLSRYIEAQTSTISGMEAQMKKSLKTLHESGYGFVNRENYISFGKFMEEYRLQKLDEIYDSGDAAETYDLLEKHRIDPEKVQKDFEFWLANMELLKNLPTGKGQKEIQESTLRKRLLKFAAEVDKEVFGATKAEQSKYHLSKSQEHRINVYNTR